MALAIKVSFPTQILRRFLLSKMKTIASNAVSSLPEKQSQSPKGDFKGKAGLTSDSEAVFLLFPNQYKSRPISWICRNRILEHFEFCLSQCCAITVIRQIRFIEINH